MWHRYVKPPTAIVYIDGFNLYYGVLKGTPYRWLDLGAFARAITPQKYAVQQIRYFTAKVSPVPNNPSVHVRQTAYLDAIAAQCPNVAIQYGHYLRHPVNLPDANAPGVMRRVLKTEEKGSDVNLAVHLVNDAWVGGHQAAVVVSNDSDLLEAIKLTKARGITIYWLPPLRAGRYPAQVLRQEVGSMQRIYRQTLPACQLPNPVMTPKGAVHKPAGW